MQNKFKKDIQYYKFCLYGFFKNLRFFDAFLMLFFLEKGLDFLQIGILYSIREVIISIIEIPSGVISDALGRRKTLIVSFAAYIFSFIVFYISGSYIIIIAAMAIFATADSFRTGIHKAMIFQYLKIKKWSDQKIDYYGHTRSWSQSGSAISALLAAVFVFYTESYRIIFLASIIPYLADMLLIYSYPSSLDGVIKEMKIKNIKQKFSLVIKATIQSVSKIQFLKVLTNLSLYTGYFKSVKDYIQPVIKYFALSMPILAYYNNERKTAIIIGITYFLLYTATAIASKYSGKFTSMFIHPRKPMNYTLITGLIIGIITGLSFVVGVYIFPIIGFFIIMIIENLRKPIGIGLVANLSNDSSMATTLSITSQTKSFFAAILAPVIGFAADLTNPGFGIAIVSFLLLIAWPIYWLTNASK